MGKNGKYEKMLEDLCWEQVLRQVEEKRNLILEKKLKKINQKLNVYFCVVAVFIMIVGYLTYQLAFVCNAKEVSCMTKPLPPLADDTGTRMPRKPTTRNRSIYLSTADKKMPDSQPSSGDLQPSFNTGAGTRNNSLVDDDRAHFQLINNSNPSQQPPSDQEADRVIVFDSQNSHNVSTEFGMNQDFISSSYAGSFVGVNSSSQQSEIEGGKENNSLLDDDTYGIKIISLLAPLEKAEALVSDVEPFGAPEGAPTTENSTKESSPHSLNEADGASESLQKNLSTERSADNETGSSSRSTSQTRQMLAAKEHSVPIVYDSVINLDASILNKVPKPDQLYMAVYDSPLKLPAAEKITGNNKVKNSPIKKESPKLKSEALKSAVKGGTKQQKEVKSQYDNEFADFEGSLDNWSKFDAIIEPDLITTVKSNPKRPVKKGALSKKKMKDEDWAKFNVDENFLPPQQPHNYKVETNKMNKDSLQMDTKQVNPSQKSVPKSTRGIQQYWSNVCRKLMSKVVQC